jgi:hypothetical protein
MDWRLIPGLARNCEKACFHPTRPDGVHGETKIRSEKSMKTQKCSFIEAKSRGFIEANTKIALKCIAEKIKQNRIDFYTLLHLDALDEIAEAKMLKKAKIFIDQTCFAGSLDIIRLLIGFQHPVTLETLCEVTQMEEIDVRERLDWLLEKKLIESKETGYIISPDFKSNSFPYKIQVEKAFGRGTGVFK